MDTSQPTTSNVEAKTADVAVEAAGVTVLHTVETMIIADLPQLGLPIIKQIFTALLGWVAGYFLRAAQIGVAFRIIDSEVGAEETKVFKTLSALIAAKNTGDRDAIKKAIQDYADAQSGLIHDDGSSTIIK